MNKVFDVISGMGLLIMLYLFLKNSTGATNLIKAIGGVTTDVVSTLQGR